MVLLLLISRHHYNKVVRRWSKASTNKKTFRAYHTLNANPAAVKLPSPTMGEVIEPALMLNLIDLPQI